MAPTGRPPRIILFGGATIEAEGVPITGRATHRHPIALLALLVVANGRPISRDKLIAVLWPERDAESARNLLKVNVHELRKALGDGAIRSSGDQLAADAAALPSDVATFQDALQRGDDQLAVECYAGPFLDGFFLKDAPEFEHWAEAERTRFAALNGSALDRLAAASEQRGDVAKTVFWRRAHAVHDPYHAEVARRLIVALAESGDGAGAIRVAESFVQRRHADLGIGDDEGLLPFAREVTRSHGRASGALHLSPTALDGLAESSAVREGVVVSNSPPASPARHANRPALIAALVASFAVLGAAGAALFARSSGASHVGADGTVTRVAVVPFGVVGLDSAAREGFVDLLASRFTGEAGPKAIDARAVALARAAAEGSAGALTLERAMAMSASLGANQLLATEIVSASDSAAISARLYAIQSGELLASARADAPAGTSPAHLADRLAIALLARGAGEPEERVTRLVSRRLSAARAYIAAQLAYRSAHYARAESLYARALDADSTFGAAGLGLAMANSWTIINENYGKGREAALHHLEGMSARDRLFAAAFFGPDPAAGAAQPAPVHLHRWEDLVEKYPDWAEAWYQLGDRYYHFGGLSGRADAIDRARHAFRAAQARDSLFAAPLHHLVEIYAARGELDDLRATAERYFAANADVSRDGSAIGWAIATALGDAPWLSRIRTGFERMPREELTRIAWMADANGWPATDGVVAAALAIRKAGTAAEIEKAGITAFALHANRGHVRDARAAAALLGAQFPDRPIAALWDLYLALFGMRAGGDTVLAADAASRLADFARAPASGNHVRRDQHHLALCMLGYWNATRNDLDAARSASERVAADLAREDNGFAKRNGTACLAMLSATIAATTGDRDAKRSVAALDSILLSARTPPHVILEAATIVAGRLHAALGDTARALVAARRREYLTGDPLFLATLLGDEARYARAMGDSAGAARALAQLAILRERRP